MAGRKVTMNDLFAEPEADGGDDKVSRKLKSLDGMNTKSRVHIQKSAVQGGVRGEEVHQALTHGHEVPAAVRAQGLQIRRPQGRVSARVSRRSDRTRRGARAAPERTTPRTARANG
jgi:hypothetical protein